MKRAASAIVLGGTALLLSVLVAGAPATPTLQGGGKEGTGKAAGGKAITNSIGMKLAHIPAGKFRMGSPLEEMMRNDDELPHEVTITRPFYLGVCEVSQEEFAQIMIPIKDTPTAIFNAKRGGGPDHPMENATWEAAVLFCTGLSARPEEKKAGRRYRLPTEAEWEYACRAGTTATFHFGAALSAKQANFNGDFPHGGADRGPYLRRTAKVGSYPANAWGLHDMHGNVAEWCADYYDKDYYGRSPKTDPTGPDKGVVPTEYKDFFRVIRGGSWLDEGRACRSAHRFKAMPYEPNRLIGFRVVCELEAKK